MCIRDRFYPVQIVANEGIQEDVSYHQHGPQLHIGGYGTVFVDNIVRMGNILNGTKYAMNPEKLTLFSNFIRNTSFNVFRSRYLDFSVTGREMCIRDSTQYRIKRPKRTGNTIFNVFFISLFIVFP